MDVLKQNTSWLHWLTKQGGTPITTVDFLTEARRLGILLPVSLSSLSKMSWKDGIYCIHKTGKSKDGSVFCRLPISIVSGLTTEAMNEVVEVCSGSQVNKGGEFRTRLSGDYLEEKTVRVEVSVQKICETLRKLKRGAPIGRLRVGCTALEFDVLPVPWARLTQVPYTQGYLHFNARQFMQDSENYKKTSIYQSKFTVELPAQYEAKFAITGERGGHVQEVNDYTELDHEFGQLSLFG